MKFGTFKEDWEIDPRAKQIRLRKMTLIEKLKKRRTRYRLSQFHAFVRQNYEATEQGIVEPVVVNSDYMKPVDGVPTKLQLKNGWTINDSDTKKIIGDDHVLIYNDKVMISEQYSSFWSAVNLKPGVFGFSIDLKKLFARK